MYKLVLIRHGQSQWNLENRFTGWTDVDLAPFGEEEAREAGRVLKDEGFDFDICYTSVLKRAIKTLNTVLDVMDRHWLPVVKTWRLNERHYGSLQGMNKVEMVEEFGEEQVFVWRRSFDTPPPALDRDDERFPGNDRRYADVPAGELPLSESLKLTIDRVLPFWHETVAPAVKSGQRVLIAAHGNSLRALVKYLDDISEEEITKLNIPTGVPLVYELDENLKPIRSSYLGDPEEIAKRAAAVANQLKKN